MGDELVMVPYVMKIQGVVGRYVGMSVEERAAVEAHVGQYLKEYDPEAHKGYGEVRTVADPREAKQFPDSTAALLLWRTIPKNRRFRQDGRFNRPLTAYTVAIMPLADALKE